MSKSETTEGFPLSAPLEAGTYSTAPTVSFSGAEDGAKITVGQFQTTDHLQTRETMLLSLMKEAEHCKVSGCFAIRGQSHSGVPPCQQTWAGDPDIRSDYQRHCILRKP